MMPPVPSGPMETTEERIVAVTRRVIEEAVQIGPAVFVGRGAQSLLAERSDALHVFCFAPRSALRAYAMEKFNVGPAEADRRVAHNLPSIRVDLHDAPVRPDQIEVNAVVLMAHAHVHGVLYPLM